MSNWSNLPSRRSLSNVPSPNPERGSYARFIPREELGEFATWNPGDFNGRQPRAATDQTPPPAPPPPTAEQWRSRIDAARQAGYQEGYRDGLSALEGFKKSHAEQVGQELCRFLQSLDAEFDGLHEQLADGITRVAVQLARQVLRSELEIAPEHVVKVAAEAVDAVLLSARHITLHVHPQDLPLVNAGAQDVLQARGARVVGNPSIARGGCRVESEVGAIDAQVATRWTQAATALGSDEPWQAESEEESS